MTVRAEERQRRAEGRPSWTSASVSRPGRGRLENQDALLEQPSCGLFLVADGVGGSASGGLASRLAVGSIRERLLGREPDERLLRAAIERANREVFALADGPGKIGTTLVALWIGGGGGLVAHVGDSRLYRFRRGELEALTEDHSLHNELARSGLTRRPPTIEDSIGRLLTRAVGAEARIEVDVRELELQQGDRFLLLTDGVLELRSDEELAAACRRHPTGAELVAALVPPAGGPDDATLVVVDLAPSGG